MGDTNTTEAQTVERFFDLVESAWWRLMQGELLLDENLDLAQLALHMFSQAKENVEMIGDAVAQHDGKGVEIQGEVTDEEYARRVASAIAVLFYGGE